MKQTIISKIQEARLVGRGGAGFPTATKWLAVKNAPDAPKYVICNASEGELGVFKDFYILQNFAEDVIRGMTVAMDFLGTKDAYININANYWKKLSNVLEPVISKYSKKGYKFTVFQEQPSYIGGEETALINAIEGKRVQPWAKPPYPTEAGLYGKPTLIHNVETLFNVAKVADGAFEPKRFYCVAGADNRGVFHLPDDWTIEKVLKDTGNWPDFEFFAQIGGSASGLVINMEQTKMQKMTGAGSIEIYKASIKPREILLKWFEFYKDESCGKCTPCREGSYQLYTMLKEKPTIHWKDVMSLIDAMGKTSYCALGRSIVLPVKSYITNVLGLDLDISPHCHMH
jgi:NADH:ubiquinone oxidoreductase subunit F (NADH-binding)